MVIYRKLGIVVVALALGLVTLGGLAVPASAHEACVNHGDDTTCTRDEGSGSGVVYHYWLDACDREPDGNKVRANFKFMHNDNLLTGAWDSNGASPGCANDIIYFGNIAWHRTCEENVSCGDIRCHNLAC
jgi:hypothetical protein